MNDLISRQSALDKFEPWLKVDGYSEGELNMLKAVLYELRVMPSTPPDLNYQTCSCAMLRMWMDNVLTDGEYNKIMDKLNKFHGKEA